MPKGNGNPLQLEVMQKLLQKFPEDPGNFFTGLFPKVKNDSDTIAWEIEYGSAGLTPFVAPGAPAPMIGLDGTGSGSAKAAFWKEKMFLDETLLNNLRAPGTYATYLTAERILSKGLMKLKNRMNRRLEWMCAKAVTEGGFTYQGKGSTKLTVNYGMPATHNVTIASGDNWEDGATRNIIRDVSLGKQVLAEDAGVEVEYAMCNSNLLRMLMLDEKLQALLEKCKFGSGDLFSKPGIVIGEILGVGPLKTYDGYYEVSETLLTSVVGGSTTTVSVSDAVDIEVGATARLVDRSELNKWEDVTISSVNISAGTVTFSAAPTSSFTAGEDELRIRKKFIDDDRFIMFNSKPGGLPIGDFMQAPFGVKRTWGLRVDRKDNFDPDGLIIRTTDKGLPTLDRPDAIYTMKVR